MKSLSEYTEWVSTMNSVQWKDKYRWHRDDSCIHERSYPCGLVPGATDDELILGVQAAHFLIMTWELHSGTSSPAVYQDLAVTVE